MHPLLPTTVVGSYSLPKWLEFVRDGHARGHLTDAESKEAHDAAVRSAIKDQELAGVDIITDGELRRETMVYFFSRRIKGFDMYSPNVRDVPQSLFERGRMKPIGDLDPTVQMPDPVVVGKIERGELGLAKHYRFLREHTDRAIKVTVTGPHMLAKRAHNEYYSTDRELVYELAKVLHAELKDLVLAGVDFIQIDEPVWVGYPREVEEWAVDALNRMIDGIPAKFALHICFGNYQRRQLFKGQYEDLFPAVLTAKVSQIVLEFARLGFQTLEIFKKYPTDWELGAGVIDVKSLAVESPGTVAERLRTVLKYFPPEKVYVNPDCGLKYLPREVAFAKLKAMVEGTMMVRRELGLAG